MKNRIDLIGIIVLSSLLSFAPFSRAQAAPKAKTKDGVAQAPRDQEPRELAPPRNDFNLTFEPILAMIGYVQGEAAYRISDQFTVGLAFDYWNITLFDIGLVNTSFGPSVKWYPSGAMRDSFYLHGQVQSNKAEATTKGSTGAKYTSSVTGTMFKIGGGYHWFWDSFNLNLGVSKSNYSYSSVDIYDDNGNKVDSYTPNGAMLEFQLGFAF